MQSAPTVSIEPLAAFADNYIWWLADGHEAVVVDPGDAVPVAAMLAATGCKLAAILVTHHHADHTGGVAALAQATGARVCGPAAEDVPAVTERLAGGERLALLGHEFAVLPVPGHTRGHIAYHCAALDALFCGDTLFAGGCGRVFEGTPEQMAGSLARLATLPGTTRVFCAHEYTLANLRFALAVEPGNAALRARSEHCATLRESGRPTVPSTLAEELATNPFLRCDEPAVRRRAAAEDPAAAASGTATFAVLRAWKNRF